MLSLLAILITIVIVGALPTILLLAVVLGIYQATTGKELQPPNFLQRKKK